MKKGKVFLSSQERKSDNLLLINDLDGFAVLTPPEFFTIEPSGQYYAYNFRSRDSSEGELSWTAFLETNDSRKFRLRCDVELWDGKKSHKFTLFLNPSE
jgi:hypothetical protein